jgi:hypothetical protein
MILPNWVPGYRLVKMTDVNENSLLYRTIANDFRQAVRQYLGSTGTPSKVSKGSFGPAYADQNANENAGMDASTEGDTEVREKGKKRDSAANKRKRLHDSSKDSSESFRTVCKACGQRHSDSKCCPGSIFSRAEPHGHLRRTRYSGRLLIKRSRRSRFCRRGRAIKEAEGHQWGKCLG